MRKKVVAANWKMNSTKASSKDIIVNLITLLKKEQENVAAEIIICPPSVYLEHCKSVLAENDSNLNIKLGAQNCYGKEKGAYTGEISPIMLADIGCTHVIIGHSERRQLFNESNELILEKLKEAFANNLTPILCIGETKEERETNNTFAVIKSQLKPILDALTDTELQKLILAYEPIWAIGTGLTATPTEAEEVHAYVRSLVRNRNIEVGHSISILYGGSVKADNAKDLFKMVNIDGGLVGGASLIPQEFSTICTSVR